MLRPSYQMPMVQNFQSGTPTPRASGPGVATPGFVQHANGSFRPAGCAPPQYGQPSQLSQHVQQQPRPGNIANVQRHQPQQQGAIRPPGGVDAHQTSIMGQSNLQHVNGVHHPPSSANAPRVQTPQQAIRQVPNGAVKTPAQTSSSKPNPVPANNQGNRAQTPVNPAHRVTPVVSAQMTHQSKPNQNAANAVKTVAKPATPVNSANQAKPNSSKPVGINPTNVGGLQQAKLNGTNQVKNTIVAKAPAIAAKQSAPPPGASLNTHKHAPCNPPKASVVAPSSGPQVKISTAPGTSPAVATQPLPTHKAKVTPVAASPTSAANQMIRATTPAVSGSSAADSEPPVNGPAPTTSPTAVSQKVQSASVDTPPSNVSPEQSPKWAQHQDVPTSKEEGVNEKESAPEGTLKISPRTAFEPASGRRSRPDSRNSSKSSGSIGSGSGSSPKQFSPREIVPGTASAQAATTPPFKPINKAVVIEDDPTPVPEEKPVKAPQPVVETRKKTVRELWEEDMAREKAMSRTPLLIGSQPMCKTGGCGYFSDDDK